MINNLIGLFIKQEYLDEKYKVKTKEEFVNDTRAGSLDNQSTEDLERIQTDEIRDEESREAEFGAAGFGAAGFGAAEFGAAEFRAIERRTAEIEAAEIRAAKKAKAQEFRAMADRETLSKEVKVERDESMPMPKEIEEDSTPRDGVVVERRRQVRAARRRKQVKPIEHVTPVDDIFDEDTENVEGIDKPTGLLNRGAFDNQIEELIAKASTKNSRVGLILLGVDYFNEYFKKSQSRDKNRCLREVAKVVQECIERRNEYIYRYDDEKIAVLVYGVNATIFRKLANSIRLKVVRARLKYGIPVDDFVTVSVGGVVLRPALNEIEVVEKFLKENTLRCLQESRDSRVNCEIIEEIGALPIGYGDNLSSVGKQKYV